MNTSVEISSLMVRGADIWTRSQDPKILKQRMLDEIRLTTKSEIVLLLERVPKPGVGQVLTVTGSAFSTDYQATSPAVTDLTINRFPQQINRFVELIEGLHPFLWGTPFGLAHKPDPQDFSGIGVIPIPFEQRANAAIALIGANPRLLNDFSSAEGSRILEQFGRFVGITLERQNLQPTPADYRKEIAEKTDYLSRRMTLLTRLREFNLAADEFEDEVRLLQRATEFVANLIDADTVAIGLSKPVEGIQTVVLRLIEGGRPLIVSSVSKAPFFYPALIREGYEENEPTFGRIVPDDPHQIWQEYSECWLSAPCEIYGEPLGFALLQWSNNTIDPESSSILSLFVEELGKRIEEIRSIEAERDEKRVVELLGVLSDRLMQATQLDEIYAALVDSISTSWIEADAIALLYLDPVSNQFEAPNSAEIRLTSSETDHLRTLLDPENGGRMQIFDRWILSEPEQAKSGTIYLFPLVQGELAYGLLGIKTQSSLSTDFDQRLLARIQDRLAIRLRSLRIQREQGLLLEYVQIAEEMNAALVLDYSRGSLLRHSMSLIRKGLRNQLGGLRLYLFDKVSQRFTLKMDVMDRYRLVHIEDVDQTTDRLLEIIKENKSFTLIQHDPGSEDPAARWLASYTHPLSWIGYPLIEEQTLLGVLEIVSPADERYSAYFAQRFYLLADKLAAILERDRVGRELKWTVTELSILNHVSANTADLMDRESLYDSVLKIIADNRFFHHLMILVPQPERETFICRVNQLRNPLEHPAEIPFEGSMAGWVYTHQAPYLTREVGTDPNFFDTGRGNRSAGAVPIMLEGEVAAVLIAESAALGGISDRTLLFLQTLGDQITSSLQKILRYERLRSDTVELSRLVEARTAELKEERDRLNAILQYANEGIFFANARGEMRFVNEKLSAITGYRETELIDRRMSFLIWGEHLPGLFHSIWTSLQEGNSWERVVQGLRKDQSSYDASIKISPILNDQGRPAGFVGILADISSLKELDRLKSQFLSNVSHELKTPLTSITTFLDLLKHGREERRDRYFEILDKEIKRLLKLIEDLLDVSRLDVETHPAFREVDPIPLLYQVAMDYEARAVEKSIEFDIDIPDQLPPLVLNARQIHQAISQLLENAFAYTPEGGYILYSAGIHAGFLWIAVRDSGVGIHRDDLPYIFDRFYRGKGSLSGNIPGTGLGLALAKEIVERHWGRIDVESEPNNGTLVTLWLPIPNLDRV